MNDDVLNDDFGIIALALEAYSHNIEENNGDPKLLRRVLELQTQFRDVEVNGEMPVLLYYP